jgi:hypothetical protein
MGSRVTEMGGINRGRVGAEQRDGTGKAGSVIIFGLPYSPDGLV